MVKVVMAVTVAARAAGVMAVEETGGGARAEAVTAVATEAAVG